MVRRNKSAIKILAPASVQQKTIDPNVFSMIEDPVIARGVSETIKNNKMDWAVFAEPGTIEEILFQLRKTGIKIPDGKYHPVVKKDHGTAPVTRQHVIGKLPTGRLPKLN